MTMTNTDKSKEKIVSVTASKLLFHTIKWTRKVSTFQNLTYLTQVSLLRKSWSYLFLLGLAQCRDQINLPFLLEMITFNLQNYLNQDHFSSARLRKLTNTLSKIKDIANRLEELNLEPAEFAYLRLCSLFGSDNPAESIVEAYQSIFSYFHSDEKTNKDRISKLILQLSSLKGIVPDFLEELFFSSLIGNIPIESVLSFILSIQVNKNM